MAQYEEMQLKIKLRKAQKEAANLARREAAAQKFIDRLDEVPGVSPAVKNILDEARGRKR